MSNRLDSFIAKLSEEMTDSEIAAGMGNGDIDSPEWISKAESTDHVKIWDNETNESSQMGFTTLVYGSDE